MTASITAGSAFIGGASMTVYTERHPIAAASGTTWDRRSGSGAPSGRSWIHENAGRSASSYLQTNRFPYETTFLDLDPEANDSLGDPVIRVTTTTRENERQAAMHAQDKVRAMVQGGGRDRDEQGQSQRAEIQHAHLWRDSHGRQSGIERGRQMGFLA